VQPIGAHSCKALHSNVLQFYLQLHTCNPVVKINFVKSMPTNYAGKMQNNVPTYPHVSKVCNMLCTVCVHVQSVHYARWVTECKGIIAPLFWACTACTVSDCLPLNEIICSFMCSCSYIELALTFLTKEFRKGMTLCSLSFLSYSFTLLMKCRLHFISSHLLQLKVSATTDNLVSVCQYIFLLRKHKNSYSKTTANELLKLFQNYAQWLTEVTLYHIFVAFFYFLPQDFLSK
jgi:hypothetical protein